MARLDGWMEDGGGASQGGEMGGTQTTALRGIRPKRTSCYVAGLHKICSRVCIIDIDRFRDHEPWRQ